MSVEKIDPTFAQLCAFVRAERVTFEAEFLDYLKGRCARLCWRYSGESLDRAIRAVASADRRHSWQVATRRQQPDEHVSLATWRDRCDHEPACQTPTHCALRRETGR